MPAESVLTDVPEIKVGDSPLAAEDFAELAQLRVVRSAGAASHCVLEFRSDDPDGQPKFVLGADVEVNAIGRDGQTSSVLFKGPVRAVSLKHDQGPGRFALVVECFDPSYQLATATLHEPIVNASVSDIVKKIAGDHGLTVECDPIGSTRDYFLPVGTPLDVLNDLARRAGLMWYHDADKLHVKAMARLGSAATLTSGDDLVRFSARVAATDQVKQLDTVGWDPQQKQQISGTASTSSAVNTAAVVDENRRAGDPRQVATAVPYLPRDDKDANSAAAAMHDRMESARVTGSGAADRPIAELWPGYTVALDGLGKRWSGDYHVSRVEFAWNGHDSFVTEFDIGPMEPSSLVDLVGGQPDTVADRLSTGLTVGIVTDNKDPDQQARVKVKLPYFNEVESEWARLIQSGAGPERGTQEIPEIGDEVAVAFEHGDFDRPYVLGGLWGGKAKSPLPQSAYLKDGKVISRGYTTRSGHSWTFAENEAQDPGFVLELADGKLIQVEEKNGVLVQSKDQPIKLLGSNGAFIEIDASGNIVIQGQKVTIASKQQDVAVESQGNVAVKATGNLNAEGAQVGIKAKASAKVESSGVTEIKGAMVKVN